MMSALISGDGEDSGDGLLSHLVNTATLSSREALIANLQRLSKYLSYISFDHPNNPMRCVLLRSLCFKDVEAGAYRWWLTFPKTLDWEGAELAFEHRQLDSRSSCFTLMPHPISHLITPRANDQGNGIRENSRQSSLLPVGKLSL